MCDSWIKLVGCGIIKCKCVRNEINKLILKIAFDLHEIVIAGI